MEKSYKTPINVLESIAKRSLVVSWLLQQKIPNENTFAQWIKAQAGDDQVISKKQIKDFVIDTCKHELNTHKISKRDVEGFLSNFIYSKLDGETYINTVSNKIYGVQDINYDEMREKAPPNWKYEEKRRLSLVDNSDDVTKLGKKMIDKYDDMLK